MVVVRQCDLASAGLTYIIGRTSWSISWWVPPTISPNSETSRTTNGLQGRKRILVRCRSAARCRDNFHQFRFHIFSPLDKKPSRDTKLEFWPAVARIIPSPLDWQSRAGRACAMPMWCAWLCIIRCDCIRHWLFPRMAVKIDPFPSALLLLHINTSFQLPRLRATILILAARPLYCSLSN